ncbi:MAG: hydrogenase expression/formation protein HypE [Bacteroidota bacterium]
MNQSTLHMQLSCPMPKLDFDIVTLGHGSGGLLTNQLLDKVIMEALSNPILDKRHDGATLNLSGKMAFTTDSFVVSPIFFPGGNIGELAVNGTVNDLAMSGAIPQYLSLSFIIEEGLRIEELWNILLGIKAACDKAGVQIVTGDTKVVERGKGDQIFINTSGVGSIHPKAHIDSDRIKVGDKIIVSGAVASHGIAIMSVREGLEFDTTITSDTKCLNHAVMYLLDDFGDSIKILRDPTRGGVASTLNELARDTQLGIELSSNRIPMLEEVKGGCELLGLDPLYVANEGIFLTIVEAGSADAILGKLQSIEGFEDAAIIGEVVENHPRQVILNSGVGGKRVVHMMVGEQLPRIC